VTNQEVSKVLDDIATMLELVGENPFKCRAYERASRELENSIENVEDLIETERLGDLPGIGKALVEKITELVTSGRMSYYEELRDKIPGGLFDMLKIPGFGPKKAYAVYRDMDITTLDDLESAAQSGRLSGISGFGKKTEERILAGIQSLKERVGLHRLGDVLPCAEMIVDQLRACPAVRRISYAGSLRRMKEVVKDIDILVSSDDSDTVMDAFTRIEFVRETVVRGTTKTSVALDSGINCDLRVVANQSFPAAMQYFTGSKDHNVHLRSIARDLGCKVNEYGVFRGEAVIPCASEQEIYESLNLKYIPPELREDTGEIGAAANGTLPDLIDTTDILGMLHCHTRWSDGSNSVAEMAEAARKRGYRYLAICDHSQSSHVANGLSADRVREQWEEIETVNRSMEDFVVLKGIEVDIKNDGSLDYPDEIMEQFDIVVGSVHQNLHMPSAQMTERLVSALSHPHLDILGHPTNRLILSREPSRFDMDAIIETAAQHGKVLELNGHPWRLDLNWLHCKRAARRGVKIAITTDAHSTADMDLLRYGVGTARRGWLTKGDVVNSLNADEFRSLFSL